MAQATSPSVYRRLAIAVFGVALFIVAVLLLTPADALPETNVWDKLQHAGTFAGLGFLGFLAFPERRWSWRLVFGLIGFGAMAEVLQNFVPGRSAAFEDAVANAIGVLLVGSLWRLGHLAMDWR